MKDTAVLIIIACTFILLTVGQIALTNADTISVKVRDADRTSSVNVSKEESAIVNQLININTASEDMLCQISGIGETRAQAIIAYREANGNFACIEDLLKVKGIGDAIFEMMKPYITV